ncbi:MULTISPECIES: hypothetical protein [unclassified Nocardioides]|nr:MULTISPECIES: hypothetical protein [unclassified Nocardioides]GAW50575.1 uncharacterized protein PD653B2_2911 [Nocardioides sp. PD653-B2]
MNDTSTTSAAEIDTASSVSRRHFIDTGEYLTVDESKSASA